MMDVFAITCTRHLCYINADGEGNPFCPNSFKENRAFEGLDCKSQWNIFQSDNHYMIMNDAASQFLRDLEVVTARFKKQINPVPGN